MNLQTVLVIAIIAASVGWLVYNYGRKKEGGCGSCDCSNDPKDPS